MRVAWFILLPALLTAGAQPPAGLSPAGRVLLHAHNCYPENGEWRDRLERALGTGLRPIAIEQDLAWNAAADHGRGQSVVSHDADLSGGEPTLEDHFFLPLRPLMTAALRDNRRDTWPVVILHLDFKSNEPEHHDAIWNLLGRYEAWLTMAERRADAAQVSPLIPGPMLVLTEQGDGQERRFHDRVPVGSRLRVFGTVPVPPQPGETPEARAEALAEARPETLIPTAATSYRRWVNFSWAAVERGGQARAGAWTGTDARRLRSLVERAHAQGLWIRFYTLNGHGPDEGLGWSTGYNFGSLGAVRERWRAAIDSRVDFVATDQYEFFAHELRVR